MKRCSKCKEVKDTSLFNKRSKSPDGLNSYCKLCHKEYCLTWNKENKDKVNVYSHNYRKKEPEKCKNLTLKWVSENPDRIKQIKRKSAEKNKVKRNRRNKDRYISDINFKLRVSLRTRLNNAIERNTKSGSAVRDLGCTIEQLKVHLESQFQPGMNWNNYGEWHIDHIKPLASFDLTDRNELLKACHYTNLQPLWAKDNLVKSNKID